MPIASTGTTSNNYLYSGEQGILLSGTLTAQIEGGKAKEILGLKYTYLINPANLLMP